MTGALIKSTLISAPPCSRPELSPESTANRYGIYPFRLDMTVVTFEICDDDGSLLCFLSASLTTPRYVLALRGSDGCELEVMLDEKEKEEVVGRTKGKGILKLARRF